MTTPLGLVTGHRTYAVVQRSPDEGAKKKLAEEEFARRERAPNSPAFRR